MLETTDPDRTAACGVINAVWLSIKFFWAPLTAAFLLAFLLLP